MTETRYQKAITLLEAAHAAEAAKLSAAIGSMLAEGTAVRFDSVEALMGPLKRSYETV